MVVAPSLDNRGHNKYQTHSLSHRMKKNMRILVWWCDPGKTKLKIGRGTFEAVASLVAMEVEQDWRTRRTNCQRMDRFAVAVWVAESCRMS